MDEKILEANKNVQSDFKFRMGEILGIHRGLYSLFRDKEAEKMWLRDPNGILESVSAFEMLTRGSRESLGTVREAVEYLCER